MRKVVFEGGTLALIRQLPDDAQGAGPVMRLSGYSGTESLKTGSRFLQSGKVRARFEYRWAGNTGLFTL